MDNQIKCFSEEHKEIDAIGFCPKCRIYMCNKCENLHSSLFTNHQAYKLDKKDYIFTGLCKETNHHMNFEYFCKNHNKLCCAVCIAKLNKRGEGQHKDCDVCYIDEIKDEKKIKLKENIKFLENIQIKFNESLKLMKKIFQDVEKDKEKLKLEIQNIFTKIRNALNNREDELLIEIDNLFSTQYFNEDIIKKGEKLPKQIKLSLEKGKLIDKEWDNINLYSYINECINIENNINDINNINKNINKSNINDKIKFYFRTKDISLDDFLIKIKSFGKIYSNSYSFTECPLNIKEERKYIVTGNNKNILTKTGTNGYWMGTICENELDNSIEEHKWKIKILKTRKKDILVGVAPSDFDIHSSSTNTCGRYFSCDNSKLYSGPPFNYSNVKSNLSEVNDEIIVVMNMKKRTLKFIINNEDKGDSYTNIPIDKPLFPALLLFYQNDYVEISEF